MTRFNDKAGGGISRRAKLAGRVAGLTALGLAAVGLAALGAGPSVAQGADDFPSRPITLIVPVAPGGGVDGLARLLAPVMSDVLKQSVVVENVPGAGGTVGLARVAKAAPDGYTIGLGNVGTHAFSQTLYKRPLYDAAADFAPVALLAEQPLALAIRPDLPAENLKEFLAYAKANQSKMQFGSPGLGSGSHIACVMFNAAAGIDVTHVPYKGGGPTMTDLIASRIDYWCPFSATALPLIRSKRIKARGHPGGRTAVDHAGTGDGAGAGAGRLRGQHLERDVCIEGHAAGGGRNSQQGRGRGAGASQGA